jgi:hypothetical protein
MRDRRLYEHSRSPLDVARITQKHERLTAQVAAEIARFDKESSTHKRLFRILRYAALFLTGVAAILGSVTLMLPKSDKWPGFLIVVVTVAAGAVTAIEGIRKPSELWLIERNIFHTLNDLRREIEYYGAEDSDDERLDAYFGRLQDILYSSSQKWSKNIKQAQSETLQQSKPVMPCT